MSLMRTILLLRCSGCGGGLGEMPPECSDEDADTKQPGEVDADEAFLPYEPGPFPDPASLTITQVRGVAFENTDGVSFTKDGAIHAYDELAGARVEPVGHFPKANYVDDLNTAGWEADVEGLRDLWRLADATIEDGVVFVAETEKVAQAALKSYRDWYEQVEGEREHARPADGMAALMAALDRMMLDEGEQREEGDEQASDFRD